MRRKNVKAAHTDLVEAAIEAELVRRDTETLPQDFYAFVRAAWDEVEQYQFKDGMHVRAISAHLQAAAERRIKTLCINIPPRLGKSTLCSVLFPAWILARSPKETLLFASYSQTLANRDSVKTRALVESEWYQSRFPHVKIRDDSNLKTAFITTEGGGRQCTSVGGTVTGLGGSFLLLDDPLNASDGESAVVRETANQWFQESWANRVAGDPNQAVRIVIMQRLHARDVSALCKDAGWDMLILPMEYEGKSDPTALGWLDPRNEFGSLLWPEQWGREAVDRMKVTLGSYAYAGQYQQRPVPRGGGIIKKHWIRYWYDPNVLANPEPVQVQLPDGEWVEATQEPFHVKEDTSTLSSWDCSFKGGIKNDYVVGQIWHRNGGKFYLLDQFRAKADFPDTVAAVRQMTNTWHCMPTLIEGKANGPAVISALQGELSGILEINPEGGKESRASSVAPLFEAGNVYLPHPQMAEWVQEAVQEITVFPRAPNDDIVDAMSQALVHIRDRRVEIVDMAGAYTPGKTEGKTADLVSESYWAN
jgi:predicted phage terminase large subunit-like protein